MKKIILENRGLFFFMFASWFIMIPGSLVAYPGFGKLTNPSLTQSCSTCHVVYPKLKLYGRTIREIGYNVPVYEEEESGLKKLYRAIPLAVRGKIEVLEALSKPEVKVNEFQLISAGNILDNKLSWWFHKHIVEDNDIVSLNTGIPHESWLQYNVSDALHIRAGMSELPLWFASSKTKVNEIGYLYYSATTNEENYGVLSSPQFGIQLNGHINKKSEDDEYDWGVEETVNYGEGYNYALAITNGEPSFESGISTFFGRITKKDPSYSIGIFTIAGTKEVMDMSQMNDSDMSNKNTKKISSYRIGTDMDLYLQGDISVVGGSFAYGKDSDRNFFGGFIGYDRLIREKFYTWVRYDGVWYNGVNHGDSGESQQDEHGAGYMHGIAVSDDANCLSAGVYYLLYGNVRIGFDYLYGIKGIDSKSILQIQFAL